MLMTNGTNYGAIAPPRMAGGGAEVGKFSSAYPA